MKHLIRGPWLVSHVEFMLTDLVEIEADLGMILPLEERSLYRDVCGSTCLCLPLCTAGGERKGLSSAYAAVSIADILLE